MHLLLFALLPVLLSAPAALAASENEAARSAFLFAERENWTDARLHAARADDSAMVKLMTWQYLLDQDSGASFHEITQFMAENPHWPDQKKLKLRAEMALRNDSVSDTDILAWFGAEMPISGIGKWAMAGALQRLNLGTPEKITALVRDAWRDGDFEETEEQALLAAHGKLLRREDDIARTDRLLWEEKTGPAGRMLARLPADRQKLAMARIALIDNKKTASSAVTQVPASLKDDPGLIYDRMRYRARRGDDKGVREMLLAVSKDTPYPEKWWRWREMQAREAIDEGNASLAAKLLAHHGQVDGQELADAIWLQGWLELEFMKRPKTAYDLFYRMYSQVRFPVSRARAAFWAARAAERAGNAEAAKNWYDTAAAFPTTFYGQLAALKRFGTAPLHMPAAPEISVEARQRFERGELARAAMLAAQFDAPELATRLINHLIDAGASQADVALAAGLGTSSGHSYLSVRGAKKALQQKNAVLLDVGYPVPKLPDDIDVERPLLLAVARQESEFDRRAKSPSAAMGVMQLRQGTAKETARKAGIGYSRERLYEADYNFRLGSHYLSRMLDSYDGSYVMALAAYNAGPGNVRKWVRQFGTPKNTVDGAILWIEKIPFAETRNYVQRVMENLEVYRHLEAGGQAPKLQIGEDLSR